MWTMAAPSCAALAASSPISRGVYGMAGHWSRVARMPVRAAVMMVLVKVLTGWVVLRRQFAQIRCRVVRWRGGGSPGGGRAPPGVWLSGGRELSYRDVAVLPPRAVDLLGAGLLQAADDHAAGLGGIDHVVDHRPTGGQVRVDLRADGVEQLLAGLLGVARGLDLLVEDDVHGALGAHHGDLGERPRDQHVRSIALAAHHVVARAVRLAHDDRDLRHGRL